VGRVAAVHPRPDLRRWPAEGPPADPRAAHGSAEHIGECKGPGWLRLYELNSIETYDTCCRILLGANAEDIVPTVTVPCTAITGDGDQYAPPEAVTEFLQQIPRPTKLHVIPGCGHLPFLEVPELFASTVKAFLRTC
jgi:pimeloyl-ACP methyl ester carboxylesterase